MPGAFAHMIAAEEAGRKIEDRTLTLPMRAVNRYPQWLQAGAVGPDYPYLHHLISSARHYLRLWTKPGLSKPCVV